MGSYLKKKISSLYLYSYDFFKLTAYFLYKKIIEPKSLKEDSRRHEFILNSILSGSILMVFILDVITLFNSISEGDSYENISFFVFTLVVLFFVFLLFLSRRGYYDKVSYILIALYYCLITYSVMRWGVSLPANLLGYALVIIMSSILINSRFGLFSAAIIAFTLIFLGYYESTDGAIPLWKQKPIRTIDAIQYSIILFLIMVLSWLSNREMEKSLIRARKSEAELKKERDSLEVRVTERTNELMKEKIEKLSQLYKFAEFGKLSSGVFHDLISPLTSLLLNVNKIKTNPGKNKDISIFVENAKVASNKAERLISTIKKQIQSQEIIERFSLNEEIKQIVDLLKYKSDKEKVDVIFDFTDEIFYTGNPIKFNQIILNLISNAIDSYIDFETEYKFVIIKMRSDASGIKIWVIDGGSGISQEIIGKIFEPLFTTKSVDSGMGLGLSTTKTIIEKDFNGEISLESTLNRGSVFIFVFPHVLEE